MVNRPSAAAFSRARLPSHCSTVANAPSIASATATALSTATRPHRRACSNSVALDLHHPFMKLALELGELSGPSLGHLQSIEKSLQLLQGALHCSTAAARLLDDSLALQRGSGHEPQTSGTSPHSYAMHVRM